MKWLPLIILITLAAWLRLMFIHTVQLYPDEFATLLAVQMIGAHGTPTMPSGLFYDHGLLFSYLGYLATFLGEPRYVVRYLSLICGLTTLALTYVIGRRHFSPAVAWIATTALALAPTAIEWSGRARMYSMMQLLVILTLWLAYQGLTNSRYRWLALLTYLGALLTHFVAITLAPPLVLVMLIAQYPHPNPFLYPRMGALGEGVKLPSHWGGLRGGKAHWLWQSITLILVVVIGFMVKRLGQPKGIDALDSPNAARGVWDVLSIYSQISFNPLQGWHDIAPFYLTMPALLFAPFILFVIGLSLMESKSLDLTIKSKDLDSAFPLPPTSYYSFILLMTTLEMMFLVSPERRDDKYLFMLLPVLCLLGAAGLENLWGKFCALSLWERVGVRATWLIPLIPCLLIIGLTYPHVNSLLANRGEDYDQAFGYVQAHWQEGDSVLTGTPAAAYFYLQRNDFYSVQKQGGYDYRLLNINGRAVDRWLASPAIRTEAELHNVLATGRVWLVLERWGLQREYYDAPFLQQLLAQTDLLYEAQGMFVLHAKADPLPLQLEPQQTLEATFGDQIELTGYTIELNSEQTLRLTLYWRALTPIKQNYTIFVHLRDGQSTLAQADHVPLQIVYPMTIWPMGETIRERSELTLPADFKQGDLWVGLYLLETGGRLPLRGDTSGENAVKLEMRGEK